MAADRGGLGGVGSEAVSGGAGGSKKRDRKNRRKTIIHTNNICTYFVIQVATSPFTTEKTRGRLSRCSTTTPPTQSQEAQNPEIELHRYA